MKKRFSILLTLLLLGAASLSARPALQGTKRVQQPDGSYITMRLNGDEYLHYHTTEDGYSLVKNDQGFYVYALRDSQGQLAPTDRVARDASERTAADQLWLQGVEKHQRPDMSDETAQMARSDRAARAQALQMRRASRYDYSKFRGLVILVEFNDCPFRYDDYREIMDEMINTPNYTGNSRTNIGNVKCTGSMHDYFNDNSNGAFQPTFDVVGPVKINRSQFYPGDNDRTKTTNSIQLMIDACTAADAEVNFKDYDVDGNGAVDMIYFIFSGLPAYIEGNDQRLLWPHQSQIDYYRTVRKDNVKLSRYACSTELFGNDNWSVLEGIGTMCHEFSHVLGLPDFYDTNNQNDEACVNPEGWSVMANGADYNNGRTPCNYSLFERYALGFAQPQTINEPGSFNMAAIDVNNTGFRIDTPVKNEFFLFENRQNNKWDSQLPGHGMLVFRVDSTNSNAWYSNVVNDSPNHPYYELLRAGGVTKTGYSVSLATASDPFPGTSRVTTLNNLTQPNLKTWSGKSNTLGLRKISEAGGVISFEVYDVNVLTSISFVQDSYVIGVGTTLQLNVVGDPEMATFTVQWQSDNTEVVTVDESGMVTGLAEGTAHITATANGTLTATCEVNVKQMNVANNIAAFRVLNEGDEALLVLKDAQVLYFYKNMAYLRDASGSIVLANTGITLQKDQVINGTIYGSLAISNRMPQLTAVKDKTSGANLTITTGSAAEPHTLYHSQLTNDYYADLVTVAGCTLESDNGIYAVYGDKRFRLYNQFQVKNIVVPTSFDGKYFDVTGIYGTAALKTGEVIDQIYLLSSPVEGAEPDAIISIENEKRENRTSAIYNLAGQKVGSTYHGVVIENGRKRFVK